MVFGLLVAAIIQGIITVGLSEVASCFPSSGVSAIIFSIVPPTRATRWQGQYHFVFILAPRRTKRFAAFVIGWMNILGWLIALCSGVSVVVTSLNGMVAFWDDTFVAVQWQLYVMYLVVAGLSSKSTCRLKVLETAAKCDSDTLIPRPSINTHNITG